MLTRCLLLFVQEELLKRIDKIFCVFDIRLYLMLAITAEKMPFSNRKNWSAESAGGGYGA